MLDICLHVVPGVTATMSSQYTSPTGIYTPDKGIDGIYVPNSYPDSLITTQSETSPWYQIDLGTNRCVRGVTIWNRGTWARMSIFFTTVKHCPGKLAVTDSINLNHNHASLTLNQYTVLTLHDTVGCTFPKKI